MGPVGHEFDDDLRILGLSVQLLGDLLLDLAEVEAGHLDGTDERNVDRSRIGHPLDAEIGPRLLDGGEDAALVGLEDSHLDRITRSDRNLAAGRQPAGDRRPVDALGLAIGGNGRRCEVDHVERQGLGAGALSTPHPRTVARQRRASGDADTQAEDNGGRSRGGAQPAPNCQIPISVGNGRTTVAAPRPIILPQPTM